jgi:hypothetical protein
MDKAKAHDWLGWSQGSLGDLRRSRGKPQARCRENPLYVVEELRRVPELEILHFEAGRGEVEVR